MKEVLEKMLFQKERYTLHLTKYYCLICAAVFRLGLGGCDSTSNIAPLMKCVSGAVVQGCLRCRIVEDV